MHHGFNCMLTFAALNGRTWVNTAKLTHENQTIDTEDPRRDSNHFEPIFCRFTLVSVKGVAGYCACSCIVIVSSNESYLYLLLVTI